MATNRVPGALVALLAGNPDDRCIWIGDPVTRGELAHLVDETRWVDGWLHTKDAATIDPVTGLVTILGRLDSQVSIGGLKVDLTQA
jgi:acyl-CoA synthetase (AMP-forming)/AMP-acid ligase II